jgi:hypothetical protein
MGYGYYFLLAIRSLPKGIDHDEDSVEKYMSQVASWMKNLLTDWEEKGLPEKPWFIDNIGKADIGSASTYSCGGARKDISPAMNLTSVEFPEILFDLYHVSWDYRTMEIYTFRGGNLVAESKHDHEHLQTHTGVIITAFPFNGTCVKCNLSIFFNEEYHDLFEMDGTLFTGK